MGYNIYMDLCALTSQYRSVSIVGMCKNAGKTTVLNAMLCAHSSEGLNVAITSIGRDGERVDIVTGTDKPPVFVKKGTFIATAEQLLSKADITQRIMDVTDVSTPLGRVVLVEALSDGFVELAGPSMTGELMDLIQRFYAMGADKVIIDGAVSRRSSAQPAICEAVILCTGASYCADRNKLIEDTAYVAELLTLKKSQRCGVIVSGELIDAVRSNVDSNVFCVCGALTDKMLRPLIESNYPQKTLELVVQDGSRVLASRSTYSKCLARGISLWVQNEMKLIFVTVNPRSATGEDMEGIGLIDALRQRINVPVYNVKED